MTTFTDNFVDNLGNWIIKDDNDILLQVGNGGYLIEHRQDSNWWAVWRNYTNHTQGDLGIQVKIQRILGASDSFYGIIWGLVDITNFYYLLIMSTNQFVIGKYIGNEWHHLTDCTPAPIRQDLGSVNEIAITILKGHIEVHINGFQALKHQWNEIISGNNVGFIVGHTMKVKVTELTITTENSVQVPKAISVSSSTMKRTHVESSNIKSVGYDNVNKILEIEFSNCAVYQYYSVPQRIYFELMKAESHGEYFYAVIRDRFQYRLVGCEPLQRYTKKASIRLNDYSNSYDAKDDFEENARNDDDYYDIKDLKYDLGLYFLSDDEFDIWLEDHGGGMD